MSCPIGDATSIIGCVGYRESFGGGGVVGGGGTGREYQHPGSHSVTSNQFHLRAHVNWTAAVRNCQIRGRTFLSQSFALIISPVLLCLPTFQAHLVFHESWHIARKRRQPNFAWLSSV
jgi:hypothetical protein